MLHTVAQGIAMPSLETIAAFHPQAALAIACGVPVRPDIRTTSATFDSSAMVGQQIPSSFAEIISNYSIFAGCKMGIDPSQAFPGNPLKFLNDVGQMQETGVTVTIAARTRTSDYNPAIDDVPLQDVPPLLSAFVGLWTLDNPDNIFVRYTLQNLPNAAAGDTAFPITFWLNFAWIVLGADASQFFCLPPEECRRRLRCDHGIIPGGNTQVPSAPGGGGGGMSSGGGGGGHQGGSYQGGGERPPQGYGGGRGGGSPPPINQ
jgi:hypothetical protein